MNCLWLAPFALFALSVEAQTNINYPNVDHVHTALNHLSVIDLGEAIQFIAAADPDSFQIERAGNKVLVQPLKDGTSTNLVILTASRQLSYELDAPGNTSDMNVLIRNVPVSVHATSEIQETSERQQATTFATEQALLSSQAIVAEPNMPTPPSGVSVSIESVLYTAEGTYLTYRIVNRSAGPFRVTTPSVVHLSPSQLPISLVSLRNSQLSSRTLSRFKAQPDGKPLSVTGQSQRQDVQAGASTRGFVLVRTTRSTQPQMYQLDFGASSASALIDTLVL